MHANVGITLNLYSHVAPTMHGDAADTVATLILDAKRAVDGRQMKPVCACIVAGPEA